MTTPPPSDTQIPSVTIAAEPQIPVTSVAQGRTVLARLSVLMANRGLLAMLDQGVVSAASLITALLIGRLADQKSLGSYHLAIGFFYLIQSVAEQTIHLPYLIRRSHIGPARVPRLTGSILTHNYLLTACGVLGISGVGLWLLRGENSHTLAVSLITLACVLPWMMGRDFVHNLLHSRLEQPRALIFDICVVVIQLSIFGTLVAWSALTVPRVFIAMGIACGITSSIWFARHTNWFKVQRAELVPHWRDNWRLGRWALGSYIVGSGAPVVLPWILTLTHGLSATGRLAACMTLVGLALMFLRGTSKYFAPVSAVAYGEGQGPALRGVLKKFTLLYLATMTPLAVLIGIFGERLLEICFGDEYRGLGMTMSLLAISFWLQSLDMVAGNGLYAMFRSDANFWADCARCVATIIASAMTIPSSGVLGVATALLLGTLAGLLARMALLFRSLASPPVSPALMEK